MRTDTLANRSAMIAILSVAVGGCGGSAGGLGTGGATGSTLAAGGVSGSGGGAGSGEDASGGSMTFPGTGGTSGRAGASGGSGAALGTGGGISGGTAGAAGRTGSGGVRVEGGALGTGGASVGTGGRTMAAGGAAGSLIPGTGGTMATGGVVAGRGGTTGSAGQGSGGAGSGGAGGGATGSGGKAGPDGGSGTCIASKSVSVSDKGTPFTGTHKVVVETNSGTGISQGTIYRPADLAPGAKYPILVWGEGGCYVNGTTSQYTDFLGEIVSHGYLLIADGTPGNSGGPRTSMADMQSGNVNVTKMAAPLLDYITWAIAENDKPCSAYYQSLDVQHTAAFGHSCGGLMAEGTAGDPRISTWMVNSSGLFSADQTFYKTVHTPVLVLLGGPDDVAYENGKRDYQNITGVPIMMVSTGVGHEGTYSQDNGGSFGKVDLAWLNWWLKGDEGATGKGYLYGAGCTLCSDKAWTIDSKNIQ